MKKIILTMLALLIISDSALTIQNNNRDNYKLNEQLIIAILKNDFDEVKKLINQGADINYTTEFNILVKIFGSSKDQKIKWPSPIRVNPESFNIRKSSIIKGEKEYYFFTESATIENNMIYVFSQFDKGTTPICFAAMIGDMKTINYLIEKGAKLIIKNESGIFLVSYYAINEDVECFLIEKGEYIKRAKELNIDLDNMVLISIIRRNKKVLNYLMENGLDILSICKDNPKSNNYGDYWIRNMKGYFSTVFHMFKKPEENRADHQMARFLVDQGANIYEDIDIEMFFDKETKVWRQGTSTYQSYLHQAVKTGSIELVKILLEKNIDVNSRDWEWNTPLYYAVMNGNYEIVELLLKHGADTSIRQPLEGSSILEYVTALSKYRGKEKKYNSIIELLKQYQKK